jgi:putative ferrous iron transport protein C
MILSELKEYMEQYRVVSMEDLVVHFDMDPNTLREMLAVWERKGKVRKVQDVEERCQQCAKCQILALELYEWLDNEQQ